MDIVNIYYRVCYCLNCLGDVEYYCVMCLVDFCIFCKEGYVEDIYVKDYDVVIFFKKFNCML